MKRWSTVLGLSLGLMLYCLAFQLVFASSGEPYDYYHPAPDNLLYNVEKYHLNQGIQKLKTGKYKEAWPEFAFMLHYFPNHPKALQYISDLSILIQNQNQALSYFEQAIKLYPQHAQTYGIWGVFLHKINHINQAIEKYQYALKVDPELSEINYNLGLAYFSQKKYKKANQLAQKAYAKGYPLNGLKNKLRKVGAWKTSTSDLNNGKG